MAAVMSAQRLALPNTLAATRPRAPLPVVARLSSGAARIVSAPVLQPKLTARPAARGSVVTKAEELTYEIAPEGNRDYAPVLGILGLVAYHYGKASINAPLLLKTVAVYQLLVAAIGLIFRRAELDNLASVVGPGILAVYTLNISQITYADAAVGLFGYYLAEHLEGPFWLWVATLVGAIYAGYPSHWYVAAFGLVAGTRLVRGSQKNVIPVLTVPTLAAAAYAFWKELTPQFTIALIIGQIVASALKYAESISDSN